MARTRFVEITAAALLAALRTVCEKVAAAGGSFEETTHGREVVFDLHHHSGAPSVVRVYTTLTQGADVLRACDSDAMRVVIGVEQDGRFRPLGKTRKILRTAPNNIHPDDRPGVCIDRLVAAVREAYSDVRSVPPCPDCGAPMALRKPKKGQTFKPFYGCVNYPRCRATKAA